MNQLINDMKLWQRAFLWLLVLAPFFFASYNFATWYTSQLDFVGSYYFQWEKNIPVIPWTIIPYWSIDLFYGISLFICTTKQELNAHGKRLLTAQVIAVISFIAFPLMFSFNRPDITGTTGAMFDVLYSFDKPFNQAPSLHITLLIILWDVYVRHLSLVFRVICHFVSILILISVLTTYQHHFIDIPSGFLLGLFCIWLWPNNKESPIKTFKFSLDPRRLKMAGFYIIGTIFATSIALYFEGLVLLFLWPAWSMLMVASCYLFFGDNGFQKNGKGKLSYAAYWMLLPYLIAARINAYLWTRKYATANLIVDDVYLGRFPSEKYILKNNYSTVIDLTAEFNAPDTNVEWISIPCLDLVSPEKNKLIQAALSIENALGKGPVLVCCALGYSRSALSIILWLVMSKRTETIQKAVEQIKFIRPNIVIKKSDYNHLKKALLLSLG